MKVAFSKLFNISLIIVVVVIFLSPSIKRNIQVIVHKGFSYLNQSTILEPEDRMVLNLSNWTLRSYSGASVSFKDLENKVVFINFWATWCPPCIAEMPELQKLYDDYKGKMMFLFVTDDSMERVNAFLKKNNFSLDVYYSVTELPAQLSVSSIPRTIVLNKRSEIVIDELGALQWNSNRVKQQLDELLAD